MADSADLLDRALQEIRTISYLLHPPLLDDIGLRSALERFVTGFSERSPVAVRLNIRPDLSRLPRDLELSIFRIVQECLTNIHKHSRAKTTTIRLDLIENQVVLTVRDDGVGLRDEHREGIGLRGMRERVLQLGGEFDVESSRAGTTVTATFPVPREAEG